MASTTPTLLILLSATATILLFSATPTAAFNVSRILDDYPEFSTFSNLLNQTKVNQKINSRRTITVLAVDNGAAGGLSGQPADVLEKLLSVHVILDYFDHQKLSKINKHNATLTTLFQTSGVANARTGFLNVTILPGGGVAFGSAANGAPLTSRFVKEVATRPYNISILQVSSVIFPPGIDGTVIPPPPPPAAPAPKGTPAPAPTEAEAPAADAPAADAPAADAPSAPTPSPAADAPESEADDESDEPRKEKKSSAGRVAVGASFVIAAVLMASL